ncbi:M15 family metallopeptidase [Methylomonas sp. MgM2]
MKADNKYSSVLILLATAILINACAEHKQMARAVDSDEFVNLKQMIPSVRLDMRYYSNHNFVGSRIDGYDAPKCLLTQEAALALGKVQTELASNRQSLKIFDCYRPRRAVDHFVRWAKDLNDQKMKSEYYPFVDKKALFSRGYIAEKSGHSRGSTVDLTIIDLNTGQELDMGTQFDFFDPRSHTADSNIGKKQRENRALLKSVMERNGFKNLAEEWWHFTLKNEPFPNRYFDFAIE